jgi:hypothetical protein
MLSESGTRDAGPLALLLLFSVAVVWPALYSGTGWGLYDWDQHLSYYEAPRHILLEFGQFPFWNPWACGGIPSFANPQSPIFSLTFLLTLPLGVAFGLKVAAAVHAFLGMSGGYVLAREHGIDRISAMLCGLVLMGSTVYTLHVAAGHTIWFPTGYVPWTFWAYVRSRTDLRYALLAGVALAAMTLHGQLYLVLYVGLALGAWAALDAATQRDWRPLGAVAIAGVSLGLLAAFKLLAIREVFAAGSYHLEDRSSSSWRLVMAALIRRDQALVPAERLPGQQWEWWEYGAYVGPLPLLLGLVGTLGRRRGMRTAAALAVLFLWTSAGWDAGIWPLVQTLPLGAGIRVPSRLILVTVLFLGLLAAAGLHAIRRAVSARGRDTLAAGLALAVVILVAVDLATVSHRPLSEAFAVEEPTVGPPVPFEQVLGAQRYANRTPYVTAYPYLLENRGVVNCFERFALAPRAMPRILPDGTPVARYRGETYLINGGTARIAAFTPERVTVEYEATRRGLLVLNQNFHGGWRGGDRPAVDFQGLVAAEVEPGIGQVSFSYRPGRRFLVGALVSGAAWLCLGVAAACWTRAAARRRSAARATARDTNAS